MFKALELLEYDAFIPRLEAELNSRIAPKLLMSFADLVETEFEELDTAKRSKKDDGAAVEGTQRDEDSKHDAPAPKKSKVDMPTKIDAQQGNDHASDEEDEGEEDFGPEDDDRVVSSDPEEDNIREDAGDIGLDDDRVNSEDEAIDSGDISD